MNSLLYRILKSGKTDLLNKDIWNKISASKNLDFNLLLEFPKAPWNWYILNGRKDKPLGFRRTHRYLPWPRFNYPRSMYEYLSDFNTSEEEEYDRECYRDHIRWLRKQQQLSNV